MRLSTLKGIYILICCCALTNSYVHAQAKKNYCGRVNPFIGTGGYGNTFPGASVPFGMIQPSPDTRVAGVNSASSYNYADSLIYGFSHTHLSGANVSEFGDFLFVPTAGDPVFEPDEYASTFDKKTEKASPGYYKVRLDNGKIDVELTATRRVALHRYSFVNRDVYGNVLIDLTQRDEVLDSWIEVVNDFEVKGYRLSKAWGKSQHIYFYARFSKPFKSFEIKNGDSVSTEEIRATGKNLKINLIFKDPKILLAQVSISNVSADGALRNMEDEMPAMNFEAVWGQARRIWNYELSKIDIGDFASKRSKIFYTALYHSLLTPSLSMDVDGQYRGLDGLVHQAIDFEYYSNINTWDAHRAQFPLLNILLPRETIGSFIKSFMAQYDQTQSFPSAPIGNNETNYMAGNNSMAIILGIYNSGFNDFDTIKVFDLMKASVNRNTSQIQGFLNRGFVTSEEDKASVCKTLALSYDNWCVAQMAKKINRKYEYNTYIQRAQYWKNTYDAYTKSMRPKSNGEFLEPFTSTINYPYYFDTDSWNFSFSVPHDANTLIDFMGGEQSFESHLDSLFSYKTPLKDDEEEIMTGVIGQYVHGNSSIHHAPYLYHLIGKREKTIETVHKIFDLYNDTPEGIPGSDNTGQTSAWLVLNALGFYPLNPAEGSLYIGLPWFNKISLRLQDGLRYAINVKGGDPKRGTFPHTQKMVFNLADYDKTYIPIQEILYGGSFTFYQGKNPNKIFLTQTKYPESRIIDNLIAPVPYFKSTNISTSNSGSGMTEISINTAQVGGARVYYTTDGSEPSSKNQLFTKPFKIKNTTTFKAMTHMMKMTPSLIAEATYTKAGYSFDIDLITELTDAQTGQGAYTLKDGIRGGKDFRKGGWLGFQGQDLDVVLDLKKSQPLSRISVGFLQDSRSWILYPQYISFYISEDNVNFHKVKTIQPDTPPSDYDEQTTNFDCTLSRPARYIRIVAKNFGELPHWHEGVNNMAWLFADEIIVE